MEFDELPQIDPNIDYNVILPIHQKRTIAFINHFILNTISFLNNFAESCESRLMRFEYKLQKIEAALLILESQLNSIPDIQLAEHERCSDTSNPSNLDQAQTSIQGLDLPDIANDVDDVDEAAQASNEAVVSVGGPVAAKDSRFARFFKMVQVGVPAQAVKLKMVAEGFDSSILDKPDEVIPGFSEENSNQ